MSGDQEPWVFRGGLVADLQVNYIFFFLLIVLKIFLFKFM